MPAGGNLEKYFFPLTLGHLEKKILCARSGHSGKKYIFAAIDS
jgi:hypothetical protein